MEKKIENFNFKINNLKRTNIYIIIKRRQNNVNN